MFSNTVDRVAIKSDEDWQTFFIPWLEHQEENNVGVDDGVFVATVDAALRTLQPQHEDSFVSICVQKHLSKVSTQSLKKFTAEGMYHLGAHSVSEVHWNTFKEEATQLISYKDDTCCTFLLNQENGLEKLFSHIHCDVIYNIAKMVSSSDKSYCSSVLMEEAAQTMRQKYTKYSQNIQNFTWENRKTVPPKDCPEIECNVITDSEESDFSAEEEESDGKKIKTNPPSQMEGLEIFYGHGVESCNVDITITPNLNMSRIFNILWLLPHFYPGFHSSYMYFGTKHSMFPLHVEDGLTWGLNFLHIGHPKIWVIIPPWAFALLDFHLNRAGLYLSHTACRNALGHKVFFPTVSWLKERNIPFKIVVQKPGDLLVLYPNAAHFGFNLGWNIAQAVNIATTTWIPWGTHAKKCTCSSRQIHLNMVPIVGAFRSDLLPHVLDGSGVVTPQIIRGMKLLHDELSRTTAAEQMKLVHDSRPLMREHLDNGECAASSSSTMVCKSELKTIKCPAKKCDLKFPQNPAGKTKLVRHVHSAHKPIIQKSQLLEKVEELF